MNIKRLGIVLLATWFGCGFVPIAPGTFGSLATVPLIFLLRDAHFIIKLAVLIIMVIIATVVTKMTQGIFDGDDPKEIVIDEVSGMLMAALFIPFTWRSIGIAFVLFRIFDIAKPFPIRKIERIKGGIGIVMDDIVAGAMTYVLMKFFIPVFC